MNFITSFDSECWNSEFVSVILFIFQLVIVTLYADYSSYSLTSVFMIIRQLVSFLGFSELSAPHQLFTKWVLNFVLI